jgi:Cu+-exporting ATPase
MNRSLDMHQPHEGAGAHGGEVDPVCGMTVDPEAARSRGLSATHDGKEYFFCGRGCMLDFKEDPAAYLSPGYEPHM